MVRRLVINADDLGLTKGVNDGIFDAHDHGVLTSASLFATAPATADAVTRLRHRPSLGIGCHLTLVDGQPTLSPDRVPTLVAGDGRFRHSWKPFITAWAGTTIASSCSPRTRVTSTNSPGHSRPAALAKCPLSNTVPVLGST